MCKKLNLTKENAIAEILSSIEISREEAEESVEKYW